MAPTAPMNSTNVRLQASAAPALIALALWSALVAAMQWTGALDRFHGELPIFALFACAVAALAYGVDGELRGAVNGQSTMRLVIRVAGLIAAASLHIAAFVALAPAGVILGAACVNRAFEARLRTGAAGSPRAKPGAP